MNQLDEQLKQAANAINLASDYSADDLLAAFVESYNTQNGDWDAMIEENEQLHSALIEAKKDASNMSEQLNKLNEEHVICKNIALKAESIGNQNANLAAERDRLKQQLISLQKEFAVLKGGDNPKRLKEQIKRLKEKSLEKDKRIKHLENDIQQKKREMRDFAKAKHEATAELNSIKQQICQDTGSGLYHNGDHHLIIWPQKTKQQTPDGEIYEGQSLLYMHQSGRGGLITYNPATNESNLCAAPRGGFRLPQELRDFAANWLFKVNAVQDGELRADDVVPVTIHQ